MSTPRPPEADVEALSEALRQVDAAGSVQTYERHARAILASDWLAARDAEHERDVAALREAAAWWVDHWAELRGVLAYVADRVDEFTYDEFASILDDAPCDHEGEPYTNVRAEAAERALADLRGEIKALADEWAAKPDYRTYYGDRARDLRALLPRDDAAGAGGAE